MTETCYTPYCTNPAVADKVIDSPFSMSSTSTKSRRVVRICATCAAQDERISLIHGISRISLE